MTSLNRSLTILGCLLAALACQPVAAQIPATNPPIEVHFSPKGGCTEAVIQEVNAARESILVQAYSFTSALIAKALVEAHKRGVKVDVILDKSQRTEKYSSADFVANMGITTRIDARHAIAHNKVMVIDGAVVITGSFNFTRAAEEQNAENLLVIRDKAIAEKYLANWKAHAEHSEPYGGRGTESQTAPKTARPATEEASPGVAKDSGEYVASVNSQVFHRPNCKSAAKIAAKNLVSYASREEAIRAGKRPCADCRP